jgi:hypothetical protein
MGQDFYLFCFSVGTERNLNSADCRMTGVGGHFSSSLGEKGAGEIIYTQEGSRHTCGARSEDGKPSAKGVLLWHYWNG